MYVAVVVPWTLGGGLRALGKGLLALGWAAFEEVLILGVGVSGVLLWRIRNRLSGFSPTESARIVIPWGDKTMEIGLLCVLALPLVPLIFHAAVETYYRLR